MSYAAFLGFVGLAFLPTRGPTRHAGVQAMHPAPAAAAAAPALRASAPAPTAPPPVSHMEEHGAPQDGHATGGEAGAAPGVASPPDVWTPQELAAGLKSCVQLLAPTAVEVEIQEPMKHGQCGTPAPLVLHSIGRIDKVEFTPAPTMNCRLAASLGAWVDKVLQPAAEQVLGSHIKRIIGASSYACRNIYNNPKLTLSEHAKGNAIDIAGFVTADGRTIKVRGGWGPTVRDIETAKKKAAEKATAKAGTGAKPAQSTPDGRKAAETDAGAARPAEPGGKPGGAKEKGGVVKAKFTREEVKAAATGPASPLVASTTKDAQFLKRVHGASCTLFATVLGPEANEAHRDHFHLDMKERKSSAAVCH